MQVLFASRSFLIAVPEGYWYHQPRETDAGDWLIGLLYFAAFVVFWSMFGKVGEMIGKDRGRAKAGMILGLCLGPLGWLLAFFLPAAIRPQIEADPGSRCPHCGNQVHRGYPVCGFCRKEIAWRPTGPVPVESAPQGPPPLPPAPIRDAGVPTAAPPPPPRPTAAKLTPEDVGRIMGRVRTR